ncbi:MAG: ATP-binding protein [Myxococcaceae bacterium]
MPNDLGGDLKKRHTRAKAATAVDPLLLDALPEALLTTQGERIEWANAAAARMLGVTPKQVVGRTLGEVLAPGELERLKTLEREQDEGWEVPAMLRVRLVRLSDGAEVPADVRFGSSGKDDGRRRVLSARGAFEKMRAEGLMSRLALLSAEAGGLLDADALLDAASAVFDELGWGVAQVEIRGELAVVRRVVASKVSAPIVEYARSLLGVEASFERFPLVGQVVKTGRALFLDGLPTAMRGPPGDATMLSESMSRSRLTRSVWAPVWLDDRPAQVLVVVGQSLTEHDFVAIQLFAAQLAAALRLGVLRKELVRRERLAAVGEMSAVLAHEVRNPIGVIFNSVSGLERYCRESGVAGGPRGLLAIIREESERLQQLVSDLLDFARPVTPRLQSVALGPLFDEALESARQDPSFQAHHPEVTLAVPEGLPSAHADPELIRRAVVNMLINAFQNVPEGGQVSFGAEVEGGRLRLRLSNDGTPLTPPVAARIFEPFFTTRAAGTGLGLAVVRRIVESLSGEVALDPTQTGVAFSIWLPQARPTVQ